MSKLDKTLAEKQRRFNEIQAQARADAAQPRTLDALCQDYIVLNGVRSPGIATIVGASDPRKWNEQPGYGLGGATITYAGNPLAHFSVQLVIWTDKHVEEWRAFRKLVAKPKRVRDPGCLSIEHPILTDLEITQVVVGDRTQWTQVEDGKWQVTIPFIVYGKPRKILLRPDGEIPTDPNNPSAKSESDRQIQERQARLAAARDRDANRGKKK